MLSAQNITSGLLSFDDARLISNDDFQNEHRRTRVTSGDVLLTIVGSIGRSVVVPAGTPQFTLQRSVAVIAPAGIDPNFLRYQFGASRAQRYFESNARGTAQKGIYLGTLGELPVRVAPLPEQRRIVSKIDGLFSRVDEGEAALKRVEKLVERYRQSVLKAAVTGELTRDWREAKKRAGEPVESGAALLARILKARRAAWEAAELAKLTAKGKPPTDDRWKQKYREPTPPDTTDLPELPEGWVWASIAQLCELENGDRGKNYPSRAHYVSKGVPFVNAGHLNDGIIRSSEMNFISEDRFTLLRSGRLHKGDIAYCIRGSLGKVGVCDFDKGAIASSLVILRTSGRLPVEYLLLYLRSALARQQIGLYDNGTAQPNLAAGDVLRFAVPVPPADELAAVLDNARLFETLVVNAGRSLHEGAVAATALRQSILKAAFSGQLVPQDPDDEPASKLLERIAAERGQAQATKARGGRRAKVMRP